MAPLKRERDFMEIKIEIASVKVMRSYDYCHFEVSLSSSLSDLEGNKDDRTKAVDDLRKEAARLADKAVEQYKIARKNQAAFERDAMKAESLKHWHDRALKTPEGERTPDEQAAITAYKDAQFVARRQYDYEDDWQSFDDSDDDTYYTY
jgi:hypothetical protein